MVNPLISRRDFMTFCGASALAFAGSASEQKAGLNQRPNIMVFLVDDMGWQDTSVPFWKLRTLFNRHFRTPNMERLANQGIKFTHAHSHAVCSPTRTSIMTGWHPARHHVTNWTFERDKDPSADWGPIASPKNWRKEGLQPEDITLPALLKKSGYHTIHCGKAHWGTRGTPGENPCALGFDVNIAGHAAGAPGSYQPEDGFGCDLSGDRTKWGVPGLDEFHKTDTHLTDALTVKAKDALTHAVRLQKPFYLYMAHYAVHTPIQPHKRFIGNYENRDYPHSSVDIPVPEEQYASMVEGMDASLGSLLDHLESLGVAENTLVIFTSDNGGLSAVARDTTPYGTGLNSHNWPLRAGKGSAYDGGTRVPYIVSWARASSDSACQKELPIVPGSQSDQPIMAEDIFPTLLAVANATPEIPVNYPLDGRDIRSHILGKESDPLRAICFHYPHVWGPHGPGYEPHSSLHVGVWKVIYFYIPKRWELYNTAEDVGEMSDVAGEYPDGLQEMARRMITVLNEKGVQWPTRRDTGEDETPVLPS